jgi:hypothetical protein
MLPAIPSLNAFLQHLVCRHARGGPPVTEAACCWARSCSLRTQSPMPSPVFWLLLRLCCNLFPSPRRIRRDYGAVCALPSNTHALRNSKVLILPNRLTPFLCCATSLRLLTRLRQVSLSCIPLQVPVRLQQKTLWQPQLHCDCDCNYDYDYDCDCDFHGDGDDDGEAAAAVTAAICNALHSAEAKLLPQLPLGRGAPMLCKMLRALKNDV